MSIQHRFVTFRFECWNHLGFTTLVLNLSTLAGASLVDQKWYLDSGCSRCMTGNKRELSKLENKNGGNVTFGDNNTRKIRGIGEIYIDDDILVKNILFVDGLHHNLISVSQLCDNQMIVEFTRLGRNILNEKTRKVLLV